MRRRKVRSRSEALAMLAEVDASGSGLPAWCRAHGVDSRSLNMWRVNLGQVSRGRREASGEGLHLVELVAARSASTAIGKMRIHHGSFTVEWEGPVEPDALRDVLWAVSRC